MYVYKPSTLGYPHDIWKPPYASNDFRGSSTAVFVQPPARQGENPYGSSRLIVCAMLVLYNYMVYNPQQENTVILGWYRFDISLTQFNITLISDIISRFPTFSDCSFCR